MINPENASTYPLLLLQSENANGSVRKQKQVGSYADVSQLNEENTDDSKGSEVCDGREGFFIIFM